MTRYRSVTAAAVLMLMTGACASTTTEGRPAAISGAARTSTAHGAADTPGTIGTLHGTLVTSGGPAPGRTSPASGTVFIKRGTVLQARIQVSDGTFTRDLPPGRYTVTADHNGDPCGPVRVTVTAGTSAKVQVACIVP